MRVRHLVSMLLVVGCLGGVTESVHAQTSDPSPALSVQEAFQKGHDAYGRKDYGTAVQWYRNAAERGHLGAQFQMGSMYMRGWGVAEDETQAAFWWRKAAEQGNDVAQYFLGWLYLGDMDIPADYAQAHMWLRKSAEQGNADAQSKLGAMYVQGRGVKVDYAQAMTWLRKAADKNVAEAEQVIGTMYRDGLGVERDYAQAAQWFRKAADHGDTYAQLKLALLYFEGHGVAQSDEQGVIWARKAADKEQAEAQLLLGRLYRVGKRVPKDRVQATAWLRKAAGHGNTEARAELAELESSPAAAAHIADNPDAQAAFQFIQRKMTIDVNAREQPEAGMSRIQALDGNICRLRCGYHFAVDIHNVLDAEFEFALADVAPDTLKWEMDRNRRAFLNFASGRGTAIFRKRARSRKFDIVTLKPLTEWSKWSEWQPAEQVACRSKADATDLDRTLKAFALLAKSCGARQTPF
jgi:TPR repeat protein